MSKIKLTLPPIIEKNIVNDGYWLSKKDISGCGMICPGMPLRAFPIKISSEGSYVCVVIGTNGVPSAIVKYDVQNALCSQFSLDAVAYITKGRYARCKHGYANFFKWASESNAINLVNELIYHVSVCDDSLIGPVLNNGQIRQILVDKITIEKHPAATFIKCGDDLKYKDNWFNLAISYRDTNDFNGFRIALQNAIAVCNVYPNHGCREGQENEKWLRCSLFMKENIEYVVKVGDNYDVASYSSMMSIIESMAKSERT